MTTSNEKRIPSQGKGTIIFSVPDGFSLNSYEVKQEQEIDLDWDELQTCKLSLENPPQMPATVFGVCVEDIVDGSVNILPFATEGNLSMLIGKAKSKKTFTLAAMVASAINRGTALHGVLKCELPESKKRVVWFDTEQSDYDAHKALDRTLRLASDFCERGNIDMYCLRDKNPQRRLELIECALIRHNPALEIGLVVIDGIRDLVFDINDPEAATRISTKLLSWTKQASCHLMTVLHQNKNDGNARGHLGTELVNKAETVLEVSKDSKNP